jgi:type II secretory pathway component GspD/PulD (secretin)
VQAVPNTPGTYDIWKLGNFTRLPMVFQTFVDLLIHDGNAKVLAQPKLVTLNGKEASMLAGQRIPYLVSQTVFAGGAAAPTADRAGRGSRHQALDHAAHQRDGYITVHVRPEVSSVTGFRGSPATCRSCRRVRRRRRSGSRTAARC